MDEDLARFGEQFRQFMESMSNAAASLARNPLLELLNEHIGSDVALLPVVSEEFPPYDHINVQAAVSAYLEEGRAHELVGIGGQHRHYASLADLLQIAGYANLTIGAADFVNLPVGPEDTLACVQFGIYLVHNGESPLAILMRGPDEHGHGHRVTLEVIAADPERSREALGEIRRLMVKRNVFRGQVISFTETHMGYAGVGPIAFHQRPQIDRSALVLPDGTLDIIERQVLGVATHRDRLRASGQHVKRGLLLHGPPGCGKTLTVRYLLGRTEGHTAILLTGGGLHMVRPACGLARLLQPAMVVFEDVDLVAEERTMYHGPSTILFDLLNELDGIADDADVSFVLTTNRADLLEPALAARPGRVDLAAEIGLPDEAARGRLVELYGRDLDLRLTSRESIAARTAGVTCAFFKELVRRAALIGAEEESGTGPIEVTDAQIDRALDELLVQGGELTRILLGGNTDEGSNSL